MCSKISSRHPDFPLLLLAVFVRYDAHTFTTYSVFKWYKSVALPFEAFLISYQLQ